MKKVLITYNDNDLGFAKLRMPARSDGFPEMIYTEKSVQNIRNGLDVKIKRLQMEMDRLLAKIEKLTPEPIVPLYEFGITTSNEAGPDDVITIKAEGWRKDNDVIFRVGSSVVALFDAKSVRRIIMGRRING